MVAACTQPPAAPPRVVFPTHPGDAAAYPGALLEGQLEVIDGCVYLTKGGERWLGLWPARLRAERNGGRVRIVDELGHVVASEGSPIVVGGGERRSIEVGGSIANQTGVEDLTDEDIPTRCGDLFWLVSGVESESV
jgi:hypothetical protein